MELDKTDWAILYELQLDARLSYAEIGRRVGLSSPAVQERIHKMEDADVIAGYRVDINLKAAGLPLTAYIRIANVGGKEEEYLEKYVKEMQEVLECHHIIGEDCYIVRIAAESIQHLEQIIGKLRRFNSTTTSIILSSPIEKRIIMPREDNS